MKNKIALFALLMFVVSQTAFAGAATDKLSRGVKGVFTSPIEICNEYHIARAENGLAASAASGVFVGLFHTGKRLINGAYDIVTFPINYPKDYGLLWSDEYPTALDEHKVVKDNAKK